ncbi:rhodopsin isoform X1 [Ptiloglossa arizonensis]|uniref:rhodopsin isoform X1 n=1 Tax=Ptiloglossa arizonensis TaxID=3350558 RepID=UPI003F9EC881
MSLNRSIVATDDTGEEHVSPVIYIGAAIVLAFIGFFGFTMNLLVAVVIVKDAQTLWTPVNVILVNLVVGDFLVAALGNPVAMVSAITGGWYWGYKVCLWYAWFMSTLGFASIGNLTVMAVERWLLVARPMKTLSIRKTLLLGSFVWVYALCLSVPPFLGWGSYGPEAGNVSCSVSWEVHDPATRSDSYIGFLFAFGLVIPVSVISISYASILLTLRKVRKRAGKTFGVRGRASGSAGQVLHLLQPHHLRGPEQPVPSFPEEDIRDTEIEDHGAGESEHGPHRPEQAGGEKLREEATNHRHRRRSKSRGNRRPFGPSTRPFSTEKIQYIRWTALERRWCSFFAP